MSTTNLSFSEAWKFPSWVEREIKNCAYSDTVLTDRKFKSGRPVYTTTFYNVVNKAIESRAAMQLIAKKTGRPYYVCETAAALKRKASFRRPARRTTEANPSGADVVEELMTELYD